MLSDAQLDTLRDNTGDSLSVLSDFLNSAPLWELLGTTFGLVLCVSIITWVIARVFGWVGFFNR